MRILHKETLYMPYNGNTKALGYVVNTEPKTVREQFVESMGTGQTWAELYRQGWRIHRVSIAAPGIPKDYGCL